MKRTLNNLVAMIGLVIIVWIIRQPVNQERVDADMAKMPQRVQDHFGDCKRLSSEIAEYGGILIYWFDKALSQSQEGDRILNIRKILIYLILLCLFVFAYSNWPNNKS